MTDLPAVPPWLVERASQPSLNGRADIAQAPIREGERNSMLTRIAGALRRQAASEPVILAALTEVNRSQVEPPLPNSELRSIAHGVMRYPPAARDREPSVAIDLDELRRRLGDSAIDGIFYDDGKLKDLPPRAFIVGGLIAIGIGILLVARGGTGKGWFELLLGVCVALGRRLGPFEITSPGSVLIVSREDDRAELERRLAATIRATVGDAPSPEHVALLKQRLHLVDLVGILGAQLDETLLDALTARAAAIGNVVLIVVDPLTRFLRYDGDAPPLNSQEGSGAIHNFADALARSTGASVLIAHHKTKAAIAAERDGDRDAGGQSSGSLQLEDLARCVLALSSLTDEEARGLGLAPSATGFGFVQLSVVKSNYAPIPVAPIVFEKGRQGALFPVATRSKALVDDERVLAVLADAGEPLSRAEWERACRELEPAIGGNRARTARARLIERGLVHALPTPAGKRTKGSPLVRFEPTAAALERVLGDGAVRLGLIGSDSAREEPDAI